MFDLTHIAGLIGYPGLFAIIFAESGTIIGFFLPGASLLFTVGFLASHGVFDIRIIVPLVAVAAILGDNVGYWFGAKVGIRLFDKPDSRLFKREYLERTREFYSKYGTRTIFFARFVPIVRTFAPILAGVAGMEYNAFVLYNIIGGVLWASGISFAGYQLGATFPQTQHYVSLIILLIIVVTTLPLFREFWRTRRTSDVQSKPRAVIFDLDDTLAESYQPPNQAMIDKLGRLLEYVPVAIASAASFPRIEKNFLPELVRSPHAANLFIFSNNASEAHVWDKEWSSLYYFSLTQADRVKIIAAIKEAIAETDSVDDSLKDKMQILDRDAKIVFTPFPPETPQDEKRKWDPDFTKRKNMKAALDRRLPDFEVLIGGTSTIDVTTKGINKAYGVRWLAEQLECKPEEMLFVGDALYEGGNDAVVIPTGIQTRQVAGPTTTAEIIDELIDLYAKAD